MERILKKIKQNGIAFSGKLPCSRMRNNGTFVVNHGGGWTDGFYIGVFNLAYLLSGDEEFRTLAKSYDDFYRLRIENTDEINKTHGFLPLDHDVGFIFLPSIGVNHTLEQGEADREILCRAADVLMARFNEKGGFIRAWDTWPWDTDQDFIEEKKGKAIIDSLMNLPLLFQVHKLTGNQDYYNVALRHAHTMADYIVRPDYSTFHTYNFDHITGQPIQGRTRQGYSDDSCWSRGQSWAVYGFALAYKYTGCERFLELSRKTGAYFMDNLNALDLPCWDFGAKDDVFAPWDSSAALICASGFLELWSLTGQKEYKEMALRLIRAVERFCLTVDYEKCQPLIIHGCSGTVVSKEDPKRIQEPVIDQALVYADYFYMECKLKLSDCPVRVF